MAALIRSNPEEALNRALPYSVRKQLPPEVVARIEQPLSARGEFRPLYYTPIRGRESEVPATGYEVIVGTTRYETHTYGVRLHQPPHEGMFLHGVTVKDDAKNIDLLALSADASRVVLDPLEKLDLVQQGKVKADAVCGVSGQKTKAADGLPVVAQYGDKYLAFCQFSHEQQMNMLLQKANGVLWASGGADNVAGPNATNLPAAGFSGTQGLKKLLYIRVMFADDPNPPQSDDAAQATVKANNRFFHEGSYGTVWWESTVTPLVRLPERKNFYGEAPGSLLQHAAQGAAALGYFTVDYYPTYYVLCNSLPQYLFGGLSSGILNGSPGALTHELGHNFGLPHARFWQPEGSQPGPVQPRNLPPWPIDPDALIGHNDINAPYVLGSGPQPSEDYGNQHDVMGSGPGHFSAMFKHVMNWLPPAYVKKVTASTTNRIYAFDTPHIDKGRLYAMQLRKDFRREYWISYRQGFPGNPWFSNGVEIDYNLEAENNDYFFQMQGNHLIDTTPGTTYGKEDAALIVGRTLSDPASHLHITPIAIGGGPDASDKWIDVVIQKGPFPENRAPTLTLSPGPVAVAVGSTVTFTAAAQDADGDALAYNWDFGDWTFGTNGPVQSKQFNGEGQFVVRCEVSDMKGGLVSRQLVVTVGNPVTYTISGRVLDTDGNPVQGVRVHNSGVKPANPPPAPEGISTNASITDVGTYRYGYTDVDGNYIIGNVPDGSYELRAFKYGYSTAPLDFTDPLNLNGNASGLNFTATRLARVTVTRTRDANEVNGDPENDGIFTITREGGDFASDLPVAFAMSGTALANVDYTLVGADTLVTNCVYETNGNVITTNCVTQPTNRGQFVIPAFVSSVDVHVVPIDNTDGDGGKTATLTLLLQTNFYRVTTVSTNFLVTNNGVVFTNSLIVDRTNQFTVPGWELRPFGPAGTPTWFQTDPTYVIEGAEATATIIDDDPPGQVFVAAFTLDFDALESREDSATVAILRGGGPIDQDLVVNYSISGDAQNGVDVHLLPGSVTIPAGSYFTLLPVVARNDLLVEGTETLTVNIEPGAGYIGVRSDDVLIIDDDLPLINIYTAVSSVPRNGGAARVTVSRAGSVDEDLVVNYLVTGTAVSGVDYTTLPGTVVIPAGQLSADININPIAGSTNSLPRTVTIRISDSTTYNIYLQNSSTVTITDNNLPTLTLARSADAISENGGTANLTITRTGPTNASLNVFFDTGGSAWEGSDYASIGTNIVIGAGSNTATIVIAAINDQAREFGDTAGHDTVIVRLRAHTNYNLGNTISQTLRITDDEPDTALPSVGFMLQRSSVFENAGEVFVFVKVTANPATNKPIELEYRVTGGSAVPGVNYVNEFPDRYNPSGLGTTGILNITHYFPPNPPPQFFSFEDGIYGIPVKVLDDGAAPGDKTLTITLFNPTRFETNRSFVTNNGVVFTNFLITRIPTNAYIGPSSTHTLTIQDLKTSTVNVTATRTHVYEAGPVTGQFIFTRDGATNVPLTVYFSTDGGTAASGSDFVPLGTNIVIPAGTNAVALTLTPIDDPTEEVAEVVYVTLLERPGYHIGGGPGALNFAQMIIVSDDGTIQFNQESMQFAEDAGPAVVPVARTGGTNLTATVDYFVIGGTATDGTDYLGTNGTITFLPGEEVKNIVIPILPDLLVEPDETFTLVLSNATGGVPLGGQDTLLVSIVNDDTAFDFAVPVFRANENGGVGEVVISRSGVLTNTDTVELVVTNGLSGVTNLAGSTNAATALDFVAFTNVVTFLPGETNRSVFVTILDDALFEGDEDAILALVNPGPDTALGVITNAVLRIVDDECRLDFTVAGYSVVEYSNFVTLAVRRIGGTVNPLSVNFTLSDVTATNAYDYSGVDSVVTFSGDHFETDTNGSGTTFFVPGDSVRLVTIAILDDLLGEGEETFAVTLSNPLTLAPALPGATLLGTNMAATVTILDDEMPGFIDITFNPGAGANGIVRAVALTPRGGLAEFQGRAVIGGDFTTVDGFVFNHVARLLGDGGVDPSFNIGAGANSNVLAVAVQPDGRVLIGGDFTRMNNTNRPRLARLNADGKLDLSFDPGTNGVNGTVRAIAVQTNGQVLIGGDFSQVSGIARGFLARLGTNGVLDAGFAPSLNGPVFAIGVQPDGKIVVGGQFSQAGGQPRASLARFNPGGTLDGTFDIGTGFAGPVNSLALQPDGRIVAGGSFPSFNGGGVTNLVRVESSGARDGSFNNGAGPNAAVHSVAVGQGGKIVVGGAFTNFNGQPRHRFARLVSSGALDASFRVGTGANDTVRAVAVQDDTAVILGGDFTAVQDLPRAHVARVHGDERLEFAAVEFTGAEFFVAENGVVVEITVRRTGSTNIAFDVEYLSRDGTATAPFDYEPVDDILSFAAGETLKSFEVYVNDDVLVEGNETVRLYLTNAPQLVDLSGQTAALLYILDSARSVYFDSASYVVAESATNAVVQLVRSGSLDGAVNITLSTANGTAAAGYDFGGFTNLVTFADGESNVTVSLPLIFNDSRAEYTETFLLRLSPPGTIAPSSPSETVVSILDDDPAPGFADSQFDPGVGAGRFVRALALQPDGRLLVGGAFTNFANSNLNYLARLHTNGLVDGSFTPGTGPNAVVSGLSLSPDGHIAIGGAFSNFNGQPFNRLVRLTSNGVPDVLFNQPMVFDAAINGLASQSDGKILAGGAFNAPASGITRVRVNGSFDLQFDPSPGADAGVNAVALDDGGRILIGGAFTNVGGFYRPRLARLATNGLVDTAFIPASITNGNIFAVARAPGGKILIGGNFRHVNGQPRSGVARLNGDGTLDITFNPGLGVTGTVYTVSVLTNGSVFIGGDFTTVNSTNRGRYALLRDSGAVDVTFDSTIGADNIVFASVVTPDQQIYIGGDFTTVGGQVRRGVARLNMGGLETLRVSGPVLAGNNSVVTLSVAPGNAYILEGSGDLIYWFPLSTNLATGTSLEITDPNALTNSYRFYRSRRFGP